MTNDQVSPGMRCVPGSVNIPVASFPASTKPDATDVSKVANDLVTDVNNLLSKNDYNAIASLFVDNGFWRDHLALTWSFRTIYTPSAISIFLQDASSTKDGFRLRKISIDAEGAARAPQWSKMDDEGTVDGIRFFIRLETVLGTGIGVVRLVHSEGSGWRIFTMYTSLTELSGHEENIFSRRPMGVQHGGNPGRQNWVQRRKLAADLEDGTEPAVFVLGAGQAGLTLAARLKALGVETLVIDKNPRVGDNWRNRYHQLVLHDPVWYDHLPYMPFPPQWPIWTPKDKLADFFESYATLLELNIWTRTEMAHCGYDDDKGVWTVIVHRHKSDGSCEVRTFHPRHVVQATGHSGKMSMPSIEGMESFQGHRLCHSSEFSGAREGQQGKKAIVVGSCNSGHDIAQDFLEKGYDVAMVQRSSTHVISSAAINAISFKGTYCEDGPPVDDADLLIHSQPTSVLKAGQVGVARRAAEHDKELLDGLTKAGFKLDQGPHDAGLFLKYFQRGGGYYIDVGASKLIADGQIKIKQGVEVAEVLPNGLRFADGSELEGDEIIFATGYENMRTQTRLTFGDDVADRVEDVWGFNEEGETRTLWQRSGHPGFWFHGGNLALCRYYSRFLALQIKGIECGVLNWGEK